MVKERILNPIPMIITGIRIKARIIEHVSMLIDSDSVEVVNNLK